MLSRQPNHYDEAADLYDEAANVYQNANIKKTKW